MTVDKLKRINLVDLLSRQWGMTFTPLPDGGHVACSPFRQESQASFYVACGEDGHWVFYDHGAGCGGSLIDLMMQQLGTRDYAVAKQTALELAQRAGLRPEPKAPQSGKPRVDLDWLVGHLGRQSGAPSRTYLSGRGIPAELLDRLERERVLLCNRLDGSEYCCFAVRDRAGQLVSLFNRKISGERGADRFLLGRQEPFCLNWQGLAGADVVYLCESIIDALSLQALHPGAVILALPGAAYDPARLQLPHEVRLIEAFDADRAGRAAADHLRQTHSGTVDSYDLQGYHDVNDLLRRADRPLTLEERLRIALSDKPSRELAAQYGLHHSRICDIRNEAKALLAEQWQGRRPGRKPKPQPDENLQQLEKERDHYKKQSELAQMRINYLTFEKAMVRRHAKEEGGKAVELLDRLQKKSELTSPSSKP